MASDFDQTLKSVEVEVNYPQQLSDSLGKCRFTVKIGSNDTFRKIKKHITESLDTQGKLMYGKYNCDESPLKRMSDCTSGSKEEKFYLTTAKKRRGSTELLNITLQLPSQDGVKEVRVAKTTTISSLKHRIQDDYAIPVEEQTIHVLGQQKELLSGTNIMQLKEPIALEVKIHRKCGSPSRVMKLKSKSSNYVYSSKQSDKKTLTKAVGTQSAMLVDPATKDVDLEEFRRKWKATEKKAQSTRDLSTMSSHKAFECTALAETGDDEEPSAQEMDKPGKKTSSQMDIHDLRDVLDGVESLSRKWRRLSTRLGLKEDNMDAIERNNCGDVDDCLHKALGEWLRLNYDHQRHGRPSWRRLSEAVSSLDGALFEKIIEAHK